MFFFNVVLKIYLKELKAVPGRIQDDMGEFPPFPFKNFLLRNFSPSDLDFRKNNIKTKFKLNAFYLFACLRSLSYSQHYH